MSTALGVDVVSLAVGVVLPVMRLLSLWQDHLHSSLVKMSCGRLDDIRLKLLKIDISP